MKVRYKIIPVDRATGLKPAFEPSETEPQFVVDIEALHRSMATVKPGAPAGMVPAQAMINSIDLPLLAGSVARMIGEMFAADVWYQKEGSGSWELKPNLWRPGSRSAVQPLDE